MRALTLSFKKWDSDLLTPQDAVPYPTPVPGPGELPILAESPGHHDCL